MTDGTDPKYVLKMVKRVRDVPNNTNGAMEDEGFVGNGESHSMIIPVKDVVDLHASNVRLDKHQGRAANGK